jgi:7,8-dihydroneopterin aldolase/epimerase/oxygenase
VVQDDAAPSDVGPDEFRRVVDYARLVEVARATVATGHVLLVETLAERVALAALDDPRVQRARVTVEKPDAFADVESVGVTVERRRR